MPDKNIVVLEDNQSRIDWFLSNLDLPLVFTTSKECIEYLKKTVPDTLYLDHDLGGETFVDSDREDTGMEVVRFLCENPVVYSNIEKIFVHSHNTPAASSMESRLRSAGFNVIKIPFNKLKEQSR